MITVDDAISRILNRAAPLGTEQVSISALVGRIAATDVKAEITQPPYAASAMDGYAVIKADAVKGAKLRIIGEAPAGTPFDGEVKPGSAVRIYTGGVVPAGADYVVIQEDVSRDGDIICIEAEQSGSSNIRAAGIDFLKGDVIVKAGTSLHEIHGSICAAANIPKIEVMRRPKVAFFANGDELVEPGADLSPGQIVNSNRYALSAMIKAWGGEPIYLGRAPDDVTVLCQYFEQGQDADVIVPIGGASVGDYDYVKTAFSDVGGEIDFTKIAVKPGKPTWFGNIDKTLVLGLPGNPASAIVTAALFLQPLVRKLAADVTRPVREIAELAEPIRANGRRELYLRGQIIGETGRLKVVPAVNQDSSLLSPFGNANGLIRREVEAPALNAGDEVEVIRLR
ncbi:gephyrin-like molybdotransferase Glp [Hyphococcus sp. DH-69]|uniref:molybdopterin molybdotransferase MoeA n=1 Tax=Hyphococcus formosus TaxID=3143534 RepID=UPI00398BAF43